MISWNHFEPLVTPTIGKNLQRFILLPHGSFISVLSYKTGLQVASLIPSLPEEDKEEVMLESVCLVTRTQRKIKESLEGVLTKMEVDNSDSEIEPEMEAEAQQADEVVAFVGCRDGTIREFSLNPLTDNRSDNNSSSIDCGPYHVPGPCLRPRRVIRIAKKQPILHLTAPTGNLDTFSNDLLLYAVVETKCLKEDASSTNEKPPSSNVSLLRLLLPNDDQTVDLTGKGKDDTLSRKTIIDRLTCRLVQNIEGEDVHTAPFRIDSVIRPMGNGSNKASVFVVLARATSIHIYCEHLQTLKKFPPVVFTIPQNNHLSAMRISANKCDVACGYNSGEIRLMNNVLNSVENYNLEMEKFERNGEMKSASEKPEHPSKGAITTKVHWHAHPVTTLAYNAAGSLVDPILYSGAEESVLVTWQLSQGTYRPCDVLPRLALGGIVHLACADRVDGDNLNGILVYCEDNSLQLIESHNKTLLWKVQGLATTERPGRKAAHPMIFADPRTGGALESHLVMTRLQDAPGFIHWYDTSRHRVSASLEVVPFNRISRTDHGDMPMPAPAITGLAFSAKGDVLITLDETPTENSNIGALEIQEDGYEHGVLTSIRFWSFSPSPNAAGKNSNAPFTMNAAMTHPHGTKCRVSALAISNDGNTACTVSNDEKSFRVWRKSPLEAGDEAADGREPAWSCHYKVTIPSGFSKFRINQNGASFSGDGTVLALCFGTMITLWDVAGARLLDFLRHLQGEGEAIDSVKFVDTERLQDVILTKSRTGVSLQSSFGSRGSFKGWSWGIPENLKGFFVSEAQVLPSHGSVAVSVFSQASRKSRIIFIDVATGKLGGKNLQLGSSKVFDGIEGCIQSMTPVGAPQVCSNWSGEGTENNVPMCFYGFANGELFRFGVETDAFSTESMRGLDLSLTQGPTLEISRNENRKRQRRDQHDLPIAPFDPTTNKLAFEIFADPAGEDSHVPLPSSELPTLSGAFVRAFVARSLSKRKATGIDEY